MIDTVTLVQVFEGLLSNMPLKVQQSEQFINQNQLQPNYCIQLMILADNPQYSQQIRLSAVTNIKNTIEKYWITTNMNNNTALSLQDKATIKQSIADAFIRSSSDNQIFVLYKQIITKIINYDYPNEWPEILTNILTRLGSSQNFEEIHVCLITLQKIFKKYEVELESNVLDHLLSKSIIIIQNLAGQLLQNYNLQTAYQLKCILKIYLHSINMNFPLILADQNTLQNWLVIIKLVLDYQIIQESTNIEKNPFWKNKKTSIDILIKMLQKHCLKNSKDKIQKQVACLFLQKYSGSFVQSILNILFNELLKGKQVPEVVINCCLQFLLYSQNYDETFDVLHPIFEQIIFDLCIPMLQPTAQDTDLYNSDPEDYIRKNEDNISIAVNKNASVKLIIEACKVNNPKGEAYINLIFNFIVQCLNNNINPRNNLNISIAFKEGIINLLGIIRDQVLTIYEVKEITVQLENVLQNYIIPLFQSDIGILKARVCQTIGIFGGIQFTNPYNLQNIITGLSQCMINGDLVLKTQSSIALQYYINQEGVKDLIRPGLSDMLSIYIKLMNKLDNDSLVSALEVIVSNFTEEIAPYAYDLAFHLSSVFYRYKNKEVGEEENCEDGEVSGAECLQAIINILEAPLEVQVYQKIEKDFLSKLIVECFVDKEQRYLEEGFSILNILLFKMNQIPSSLWIFYPFMCYCIIGVPQNINLSQIQYNEEYYQLFSVLVNSTENQKQQWAQVVDSMVGPLKNYFQKGKDIILQQNDIFGQNLVKLLFDLVEGIYQNQKNFTYTEQAIATSLIIGFVENMQSPQIDHILQNIIEQGLSKIKNSINKNVKIINIQLISICLYYNPLLTLNFLVEFQCLDYYFQAYFENLGVFKTDFEKQRMLVGISSILKLQQSQLPQGILNSFQGLVCYLVQLTTEIIKLREKGENKEDNNCNSNNELQKLQQQLQQYNDNTPGENIAESDEEEDDEEDEDFDDNVEMRSKVVYKYISPLEMFDEILYLEKVVLDQMQNDAGMYGFIIGCLGEDQKNQLNSNFNFVKCQNKQQLQS
ncbi:hypothetical protein IMG5_130780 [Ichthyophthirius multifiliis]|uniref:Importin N-terminal domain-containing protein n=1 Tax=Ichthyophthirius multifiliis TaxID=5932 RepID=G0QWB4_ICHMU|nr:hypothetical protein IMG5_130780 [Ichthyophthirius multifiliis]EGR30486.1 hypothetical protein IMG5_130780 [Ichthyophthirius multifiliis]|eukprot:XP_004032073.1 hypothetical protein IMG5_130780 [Ichthyophthirius multifiliis]